MAIVAASHSQEAMMAGRPIALGTHLFENIKTVIVHGIASMGHEPLWRMLWNSFCMAIIIACGKIIFALGSAFALVYYDLPFKKGCFALIFVTLMLPIEVRLVPTFHMVANFGWLNSFRGLTFPLMASATATFLLRQFFKTIPSALLDAARLDGASFLRFLVDIAIPLAKTHIAALFIIFFVYGWNQYIWPLIITTSPDMKTIVMGLQYVSSSNMEIPEWHLVMSMALVALLPPCLVMLIMQRFFEEGFTG